ncbi:MAG TPA: hypothetical protein VEW42_03105 [Candidatus Eisenbacteria bacterium]|nr:hypothetical protein [Candidatus Eisenbacteria bacterium]
MTTTEGKVAQTTATTQSRAEVGKTQEQAWRAADATPGALSPTVKHVLNDRPSPRQVRAGA